MNKSNGAYTSVRTGSSGHVPLVVILVNVVSSDARRRTGVI